MILYQFYEGPTEGSSTGSGELPRYDYLDRKIPQPETVNYLSLIHI